MGEGEGEFGSMNLTHYLSFFPKILQKIYIQSAKSFRVENIQRLKYIANLTSHGDGLDSTSSSVTWVTYTFYTGFVQGLFFLNLKFKQVKIETCACFLVSWSLEKISGATKKKGNS